MKVITPEEAVKLVKDNDMVGISGSGGSGSPENLLSALRLRYQSEGRPRSIGVTCGICAGDRSDNYVGSNNLIPEGLVGKAICGHLGRGKLFAEAMSSNQFAAYAIPLGVYGHLLRAKAGHQDGIVTHIGLNTYCDPRLEGCRCNEVSKEDIVELVNIDGKELLYYKTYPINVAFIKASFADEDGNVSLYKEAIIGEQRQLASAVHNNGGIVICEVDELVPAGSILPKKVDIFKKLVDYVCVCKQDESLGDYNFPIYKPELIGEKIVEPDKLDVMPLNERKVCARRACLELKKDDIVNCGIGMPDGVGFVAAEEGFSKDITISIETGVFGGVPVYGNTFGAAVNPISLYPTTDMFDLYDGGIIDDAVLGLAETDRYGNVNVSKVGNRVTGPGGFIDITQGCRKAIFIGTFTAGGLKVEIHDGRLQIVQEGKYRKFIEKVSQVTFASKTAVRNHQEAYFVTERAVFRINEEGLLELIEIAPGIDLEKDVLANMDFRPLISEDLKLMDDRIFRDEKMGLVLD